MANVKKSDISKAAVELGISAGDSVIIHSSLKSLGMVEGGADAVIDGFSDVITEEGTLLFPTLCQKDWEHVYENWHPDVDSDVGYITNVFRKREGVLRSNQATHSVAALGKDSVYFTKTHGETGKRYGIFGDTPFSVDSPWEKMYEKNTKIVFLGVEPLYATTRHYAEYVFVNNALESIKNLPEYEEMKSQLWHYGGPRAIWPHIENIPVYEELKKRDQVKETICGNATLKLIETKTFVDFCFNAMNEVDERFLWDLGIYYNETLEWLRKVKSMKGSK